MMSPPLDSSFNGVDLLGQGAAPEGGGGAVAPAGANLVSGQLDGADDKLLFHKVNIIGPGTVTLTFSVKATDKNAGARFGVVDANSKVILPATLVQGVDGGNETVSKTITFANPQKITIAVQGVKYGDNGGYGIYSVQLSGPVEIVK
jgi:hypothetical protein